MIHVEDKPKRHSKIEELISPANPCVFVIFGVVGDLTSRLLLPSLYNLANRNLLPERFALIGIGRAAISEQHLRQNLSEALRQNIGPGAREDLIERLVSRLRYICSDFDASEVWAQLPRVLAELDQQYGTAGNYLFYTAIQPQLFLPIVQRLGEAGLLDETNGCWRRVVIEKPFGTDAPSARELNRGILAVASESQIYRIDHYLGKETVQNIAVFRFANGVFEPIWNRRYIDHVQITVAEELGVEGRGNYYDKTGALRDMMPNHLVQLLALVAMEAPSSFSASAFRGEQSKVLEAVLPIAPDAFSLSVVRGQYAGYCGEPRVDPNSQIETFVAMKVAVDNWRWSGVPFYLRTGKKLRRRTTQIVIQFKNAPLRLFRQSSSVPQANRLVINIQPEETIALEFRGKIPGPGIETQDVQMEYNYCDYFAMERRTGYENLLYDAMNGDSSMFKRADMIESGWAIVQPVLDAWSTGPYQPLEIYAAGSDGPENAARMLARDGRSWRSL